MTSLDIIPCNGIKKNYLPTTPPEFSPFTFFLTLYIKRRKNIRLKKCENLDILKD